MRLVSEIQSNEVNFYKRPLRATITGVIVTSNSHCNNGSLLNSFYNHYLLMWKTQSWDRQMILSQKTDLMSLSEKQEEWDPERVGTQLLLSNHRERKSLISWYDYLILMMGNTVDAAQWKFCQRLEVTNPPARQIKNTLVGSRWGPLA